MTRGPSWGIATEPLECSKGAEKLQLLRRLRRLRSPEKGATLW